MGAGTDGEAQPGVAAAPTLTEALRSIVEEAVAATGADLVVARLLDREGVDFAAAAVAGRSPARAAEAGATRFARAELPERETDDPGTMPAVVRRLAERARAQSVVQIPAGTGNGPVAALELLRVTGGFAESERAAARLAAGQLALAVRAYALPGDPANGLRGLELAGDALVTGADDESGEQLARLAADAAGALGARIWRADEEGRLFLAASSGLPADGPPSQQVLDACEGAPGTAVSAGQRTAAVRLGRPALGVLELVFGEDARIDPGPLAAFAARAAQAVRVRERGRALERELERSRALLAILGQAIAQLSLTHTLETAVRQVTSLLGVDRAAIYLRDGDALVPVAGYGTTEPGAVVAEQLLELALGPSRARGLLVVSDVTADARLRGFGPDLAEAGIEAAIALPLVARDEVIGLLAVYPDRGRTVPIEEEALLTTLAGQLAVAVQNARLHEQAKALSSELEAVLVAERESAARLKALYEIAGSFAESLSLDATLDAIARAAVESLELDAAVLRVPDPRGEAMITQAVHVADERLDEALSLMLSHAQVLSRSALQRLFRHGEALRLTPANAASLGGSFTMLVPFVEKGSTVVIVPVATPAEVLATLTLISLDGERPIDEARVSAALTMAGQAALAVENANLYQQQKQFADAMQRSLLPRELPRVEGLDIGVVYESAERLDVGGDVYDFMKLDDGRLAVVLGDVTGHGVTAAADMAMAKFVFRSLAREHPDPADLLASANEVVVGEFPSGKFLTLLCLTIDPATGVLACASAGHPQPRVVAPDGEVGALPAAGLALGVEADQTYEEVQTVAGVGTAVVLYTDGVIEARLGTDMYGVERLDALLAARAGASAQELAEAVLADCRRFAGGELADDCAIVVLERVSRL